MAKVTSKLQLTIPKAVADQYGIRPGDELDWIAASDVIRVVPPNRSNPEVKRKDVRGRLRLFDQATKRQRRREASRSKSQPANAKEPADRGWKRQDLYTRGRPR